MKVMALKKARRKIHGKRISAATALVLLWVSSICLGCMSEGDIYAQRVGSSGTMEWTANGVPICTVFGYQHGAKITPDGAGGAILTWWDPRPLDPGIYAQRVLSNGTRAWTPKGVRFATGNYPQIITDGAGGAIVTWQTEYDIYAQRLLGSGTAAWTPDGVPICTAPDQQLPPTITNDGEGGAIIAWRDCRNPPTYVDDIYAQKVLADGTVAWTPDGVLVLGTPEDSIWGLKIVTDGAGGALIAWSDLRHFGTGPGIYAQRVLADGTVAWSAEGVLICSGSDIEWELQMTADGVGGAIIVWQDERGEEITGADIYAQRILSGGTVVWIADGVPICTANDTQNRPQVTADGGIGSAIIAWDDSRDYGIQGWDIYAQRILSDGTVAWTPDGVVVCDAAGDQWGPQIVSDHADGTILSWWDGRGGSVWDIYVQRILSDGTSAWTANGLVLCDPTGQEQGGPPKEQAIIPDGAGGAILTWDNDKR